jgi:FKBP-type peptidyl-prolyl cis-trans isomerase
MKFIRLAFAIAIVAMLAHCSGGIKKVAVKTEMDSLSYCLGYSYAMNIKEKGKIDSINKSVLYMAMEDYYTKKKALIEPIQMDMFIQQFLMKKQAREQVKTGQEAKNFLEKNKSEKGVIVTPSGLQYLILKEGNGPSPRPFDTVYVAYRGSLVDGTVFDSTSVSRPAKFLCQGLIPGWIEALQMMKAGSKWKLFISPELGYGARPPMGSLIKPNAVLIFEVEMFKISVGKEPSKLEPKKK